jgi:hypothetical protein
MKKLLLISGLILSSLSANAQQSCASPTPLNAPGTFLAPAITGSNVDVCWETGTTDAGGPLTGLWYSITPSANGEVTISSNIVTNVAPLSNDTKVSVFTGTCGDLTCYASADDISSANYKSTVTFNVLMGTTYYIQWDNYWNGAGFNFTYAFTPIACLPADQINLPTNVTATSVTLNWEIPADNPDSYEIEWGPTGFFQEFGTTVTSPTNSVTINSGLAANTNYEFYIRSICSDMNKVPGKARLLLQQPKLSHMLQDLTTTLVWLDGLLVEILLILDWDLRLVTHNLL